MSIFLAIQGAVSQGILWGIAALGIFVTFRLLDIADMSVDGTFATGGCVAAIGIASGLNPFLATLLAMVSGFLAGSITGVLHTRFKIPSILAGILTQLGLYSIDLRILGRSNLPLLKVDTIFDNFSSLTGLSTTYSTLILGIVFALVVTVVLYWFFGTEIGSAIRATGSNEQMVRSLACNTDSTKMLGLMISNSLVALSGALVTQSQGYADVKMGTGAIVIGLASIIIGEVIVPKRANFWVRLSSLVLGSIIYRIIIALVLQMGLNTDDLKLLTAVLVGLALAIPTFVAKRAQRSRYKSSLKKQRGENNA